ncbi:MAG TPA: 7-carboxy-7-deazaguanine synthase QueE [bacterium]
MAEVPEKTKGGYIGEIFSSFQGEGIWVGIKQIFVRFLDCSLGCVYCDTPYSRMREGFCSVESIPGKREFLLVSNPIPIQKLTRFLNRLEKQSPGHHSVSVTGGEPLEQADFLAEWLPAVKRKLKIYLETNGTMTSALEKVLKLIDIVAMDIKLPSATRKKAFWHEHLEFMKLCRRKAALVKVIITSKTDKYEVLKAALLVKKINKHLPFIIQPATEYGSFKDVPEEAFLISLQSECARILKNVRVIPQIHKLIGMR